MCVCVCVCVCWCYRTEISIKCIICEISPAVVCRYFVSNSLKYTGLILSIFRAMEYITYLFPINCHYFEINILLVLTPFKSAR